ncbi:hypothetical protein HN011_002068 [Eciton burchellii]|nr:hypothetical protein HN011_002068 [Eciton burchellii]
MARSFSGKCPKQFAFAGCKVHARFPIKLSATLLAPYEHPLPDTILRLTALSPLNDRFSIERAPNNCERVLFSRTCAFAGLRRCIRKIYGIQFSHDAFETVTNRCASIEMISDNYCADSFLNDSEKRDDSIRSSIDLEVSA